MKKLAVVSILAISTFVMPTAILLTPANALTCGVDAPAGWERDGGFCDALKSTKSLSTPVEGAPPMPVMKEKLPPIDCIEWDASDLLRGVPIGERVLVAVIPYCNL